MSAKLGHRRLRGVTVAVTRALNQAAAFKSLLEAQGAKVLIFPTIRILPPKSFQALLQPTSLKARLAKPLKYSWSRDNWSKLQSILKPSWLCRCSWRWQPLR